MKIFYLKKNEFLSAVDKSSLEFFSDNREYKSNDKRLEHLCGLFLTKFIAKHIYHIKNTDIEVCSGKPFFVSKDMFFSISHSKGIILAAFSNKNIGADVEYMKECDYKGIMSRYGVAINGEPSKEDFYKFWTLHEARIKLGYEYKSTFSEIIEDNYLLSCVGSETLISDFEVLKLSCSEKNIDLKQEFENPKYLKLI